MTPALAVRGLRVRFGGVLAVEDLSLVVGPGERVALIGPNGAGKSTVLDALSGLVPYEGSVSVRGASVDGLRAHRRVALGLVRTFQSLELFDDLTVYDNVAVGGLGHHAVTATLKSFGLAPVSGAPVAALRSATRRLVALARAVAVGPRVLLIDELAAGMDGQERVVLAAHLAAVASTGTAIVAVDHDLRFVSAVCDRVVVLDAGVVVATGTPAEVRRDPRVVAAYVGAG